MPFRVHLTAFSDLSRKAGAGMYMRRKQSEKGCLFLSVFPGTYVQTGTGCRLVSPPDLSEAYSDSGQFQFLARIYFIHIINSVQ